MKSKNRYQKGSAVFLLMLAFFVAFVSVAVSQLSVNQLRLNREQKDLSVLAKAKQALIDYERMNAGSLPCPDSSGDGLSNGSPPCSSIGFLPWKTLQLNEIKDSLGNVLRYQQDYPGNTIQVDAKAMYSSVIIAPLGPSLEGENNDADNTFVTTEEKDMLISLQLP